MKPAPETPFLVRRALYLAVEMDFDHSCSTEVGRLLRVLTARVRRGVVAEIGTGCGVGAAWISSSLNPGAAFVTVESDAERAAAVRRIFQPLSSVRVIRGDWREVLGYGPFALLFADGGKAKEREPELLVEALEPGGIAVIDDLTPVELWPPEWRGNPDPVREFWLKDPRLVATEVYPTPRSGVILAVRR